MKLGTAVHLIGILAILNLQSAAANNFIPLAVGEDFATPFGASDLLRGFKQNIKEGESAFKAKPFKGTYKNRPFATEFVTSEVITSAQSVTDSMEIQGSLAVSYGPMSGEGAGRFLDQQVNSKKSVTVVYTRRSAAFAVSAEMDQLVASDGLKAATGGTPTPDDANLIAATYGTKFVDQILYGSQLDLRYTVTSEVDIDIQEIEAELKGKIGFGPFSASFSARFEQKSGTESADYRLSIEAKATGVNFQVPSNPSFEEANQIIDDFNLAYQDTLADLEELREVEEETNVLKQLTPVGFTVASIADHLTAVDKDSVAILDERMGALQKTVFSTLWKKSQLGKAVDENKVLYATDPRTREELFAPYALEASQIRSELDVVIKECLKYRELPLADILVTSPPSGFGGDGVSDQIFFGLIGEGYIPPPLNLEGDLYSSLYYTGFAVPDTTAPSGLKPYFSGAAFHDNNEGFVADGFTTRELAEKVSQILTPEAGLPEGTIGYQQKINILIDEISGIRRAIDGGTVAATLSGFEGDSYFDLQIFADPIDIFTDKDTKSTNECVKYGDMVYIRWEEGSDKFLKADVSTTFEQTVWRNPFAVGDTDRKKFEWKIQSVPPIDGDINRADPKEGQCVKAGSDEVLFQNNALARRWLTGGRSLEGKTVKTNDLYTEVDKAHKYHWELAHSTSSVIPSV